MSTNIDNITYDSWGNRNGIEVTEKGRVVRAEHYQLDPLGTAGQILTMQEEPTGETTRVFYGKELLGGSNETTSWTYQTDRLGSVIGRGDFTGRLAEEQWYEEFGAVTKREGTSGTGPVFGFAGYLYEELIGLYDARARYYDPTIGGFLEKDRDPGSVGIALQRNRYGYCWNNPLRYVDPTGNYEVWVTVEEFLKWVATQLGTGMGQVVEIAAGAIGTAVSTAVPYVAIAVGAVTVVVTLDSFFEDTDSVLREPIREGVYAVPNLKKDGEILVPPRRTKELGDGIDLGPRVLYHPDGTWILEVPPKLELPILEAFTASLLPGLTILMAEATEGNKKTEKNITADKLVELANNSKTIDGLSGKEVDVNTALEAGQKFVGKGYKVKMANGSIEYTSKDGTKRFRLKNKFKNADYEANYEVLKGGKAITNYHVVIKQN